MAKEILTTFQLKRGTADRWIEVNPILKQGEPGFEFDTNKLKIGDGITPWAELSYIASSGSNNPEYATIFYVDQATKKLIGSKSDSTLADTIWAAKNYTDEIVQTAIKNLNDILNLKSNKDEVYTKEEIGDLNNKTVIVLINEAINPLKEAIQKNTQDIQTITGGINTEGSILNIVNKAIENLHLNIEPDGETIIENNGKISVNKVNTDLLANGELELILFSGDANK